MKRWILISLVLLCVVLMVYCVVKNRGKDRTDKTLITHSDIDGTIVENAQMSNGVENGRDDVESSEQVEMKILE